MDKQGLLLCAKYAAAPNFFNYCGPDKNQSLIDHLKDNLADKEITHLLSEFETLYPYLTMIAYENEVKDPFDKKVVEAYWIGNNYLNNLLPKNYLSLLEEKLQLIKKIDRKSFVDIKKKVFSLKFLPHHNFHVINIFKNNQLNKNIVKTMDECRINYGRIQNSSRLNRDKMQNYNSKIKNIFVKTKQLTISDKQLSLKQFILKEIKLDYKNKIFLHNLHVGDWVSFHWGMVCDKLTDRQVKNLEYYTQKAIAFYNS